MKLLLAFFRLIRWPNLIFIALTQFLFYYFIIIPSLPVDYFLQEKALTPSLFYILVIASVLIAAAGYIINDYFDINIDQVNKPAKMVVQKIISRHWAILFHLFLQVATEKKQLEEEVFHFQPFFLLILQVYGTLLIVEKHGITQDIH